MRHRALHTLVALAVLAVLTVLPVQAQQESRPFTEEIQGKPYFDSEYGPAYHIWSDDEGIHVRWSTREEARRRFRGEVTTDGSITAFRGEALEPDDDVRRTGNAVVWDAYASTGYDEFVFTVSRSADWLRFTLQVDGRMARVDQIFLGRRGAHPAGNPFVLRLRGEVVRDRDRWPAVYRGQPPLPSSGAGYFVWVDDDVWHVRWIARGGAREFSGLITTEGRFQDIRKVQLEGDDAVARDQRLIGWESRGGGGMDGIDFRTSGDRLNMTLLIDGVLATTSQIFLGSSGAHPSRNPWRVTR